MKRTFSLIVKEKFLVGKVYQYQLVRKKQKPEQKEFRTLKKISYSNYNKQSFPNKYVFTNLKNQPESHETKGFRQFKKIRKAIAKIKFSVNRSGKDKNWDYEKLSTKFENTEGTVETVLEAVKAGYAINGAWFKGRRKKANVLGVQLLLVDIDNTAYQVDQFGKPVKDLEGKRIPIYSRELTIEDAIAHPFIQKYCAFIYTTASHKPEWHKLRLGFVLPEQIDRETYESLGSIVLKEFPHDEACKDAGRVFFGNSNTEIILCNSNVVLDSSFIEAARVKKEQDAIARKEREVELQQRREEIKREWAAYGRTEQDLEQLVREALSYIPPRQQGSGNYNDCLKILTALKNEFGDSLAVAIASEWSPSTRDWNLERKISGLDNSTIGVGTIFHFAKENGWEFPQKDSFHSWQNYLEPDQKEYQEYCTRLEEEARIEEADTNWRDFKDSIIRGNKQKFIKQQWDNWRNYKKFTSQVKIDKKFIEYDLPEKNTITFIKSGLGTGKTTQLTNHLNQLENEAIINLGYRNTLLLQFNENTKEISFYHLQSDKNLKKFSLHDPQLKVSLCIDSLIYFIKEQFDGKIVIIDEIISVLKHLLFSATIKNFAKVKELFTEMVNRADRLILLDGFMQDWAVNFFKELCPDKKIITIENTFKGDKSKVYLLEGTIDFDEKIKANDKSPWLKGLLDSDRPVIASDSQLFCEAMENLLLAQGKRGIRVDSKTVSEEYIKKFFTNPDKWIEVNQPDYLIYSPSAESGLDIPIRNYFTEQFCFFFGSLDIDSCIQMIGRIRDTEVPRYVWCKQFIQSEDFARRPSNLESIQSDRARNLMAELNCLAIAGEFLSKEEIISNIQQIYKENLDCYCTAADTIKAIRNHEFSNYRECLKQQLVDSGYQIEALTPRSHNGEKAIAKKERESKDEVKSKNSQDIYQASDRYIGQPNSCLNFDASWGDRCAVEKAKIVDRLPEINKSEVWSANFIKLIKYDEPQLIKQIESYYLLENPDIAEQITIHKYNKVFSGGIASPWKLRHDYLRIKALRDIGLYDWYQKAISTIDYSYTIKSFEVIEILRKCSYRKNKQILGAPGKDKLKFFNNLLRSLGIVIKSKRVRNGGSIDRIYSIDKNSLMSKERLAIYQAIKLKYAEKVNLINSSSDLLKNSLKKLQKFDDQNFEKIKLESIDMQSLKGDPHHANFYIKNKTKWIIPNNSNPPGSDLMEKDNTSEVQNLLDSDSAIADLASYLEVIESAEELSAIQEIQEFTPDRLRKACKLLSVDKVNQIRKFAIINHQKRSKAN